MKVILQQPRFLPWAGHWHKVLSADLHIIYAGVKFDRTDYIHRVKVGEGNWLTLPLEKAAASKLIKDIKLCQEYKYHMGKMAKTIRQLYMHKNAPYGDRLGPIIIDMENWHTDSFLDTVMGFHETMSDILGLRTKTVVDLDSREDCDKLGRVDACLRDWSRSDFTYLMGSGGHGYMTFDSLTSPEKVLAQEMRVGRETYTGSMMKQIAYSSDPLSDSRNGFKWVDKHGDTVL